MGNYIDKSILDNNDYKILLDFVIKNLGEPISIEPYVSSVANVSANVLYIGKMMCCTSVATDRMGIAVTIPTISTHEFFATPVYALNYESYLETPIILTSEIILTNVANSLFVGFKITMP